MNAVVTAEMDAPIALEGCLVKELAQHRRAVRVNFPVVENSAKKTYTMAAAYNKCCDILSTHYGCDVRTLER